MIPPRTLAPVALAFLGALACTWLVRGWARRRHLLDHPNERSSHSVPVPRLGGIGVVVAFLAGAAAVGAFSAGWRTAAILGATAAISAAGLLDDLRPLPARARFAVQVIAAAAVVAISGPPAGSPWLQVLPWPILAFLLVIWIVWLTNLYNFMDGIDGLAGGQGVIAAAALAAAAFAGGAATTGSLLLVLAAAIGGFLVLNFPPASIFMGDVGSTAIGFFLGCVPLLPDTAALPVEVVGIALALFVLDATVTLLRRMARGERWSQPHRTHYYQRPVAMGVPHRTVTLVAYAGMSIAGACALAYGHAGAAGRALLLCVPVLVFVALATAVHVAEHRGQGRGSSVGEQLSAPPPQVNRRSTP